MTKSALLKAREALQAAEAGLVNCIPVPGYSPATLQIVRDGIADLDRAIAEDGWRPIETAPKDGRALLLGYTNQHGRWRTLRGRWVPIEEILEEWQELEDHEEGWYEAPVEPDEIPNVWETTPTHWMPLPAPPIATENASQEAGK